MRSWQEQLDFEASEKKRIRAEWVRQAAALKIGVKEAAQNLGMETTHLHRLMKSHGIKSSRANKYQMPPSKPVTMKNMQLEALQAELRDRTARKVAAGMVPKYARLEAAREMQMEAGL